MHDSIFITDLLSLPVHFSPLVLMIDSFHLHNCRSLIYGTLATGHSRNEAKPSKIGMSRISKIDSEFLSLFSTQLLSNDANECLPESPFVSGKFPLRFNSCSFLCCLHSRRNGLMMICHHNNPGSERRYSRSNLSPSCLHQRRVCQ